MILQIYGLLLAFSIIILFYGFYSKIDAYKIIASTLLFILGTMLLPGANTITDTLEYKVGENSSLYYVYGDNYTSYHWDYMNPPPSCPPNNLDCVKLFHEKTTTIDLYQTYENHTLGFFLTLAGIVSLIVTMVDRRGNRR